jgi:hypothetical protein
LQKVEARLRTGRRKLQVVAGQVAIRAGSAIAAKPFGSSIHESDEAAKHRRAVLATALGNLAFLMSARDGLGQRLAGQCLG